MTDKGNSHADRLEQALARLEANKKAAASMAAGIDPELERLAALNNKLEALPQSERRQVLDAMGLNYVSAAPNPITPLRGLSYTPASRPPEPPPIDWRYWRHNPAVKQWEACALSLNINPDNMKHNPQGWMAGPGGGPAFLALSFSSVNVQLEFDKRVRLLGASLFKAPHFTAVNNLVRGGRHLATVSLKEFAAWALHVELEGMPPELLALAETKAAPNLMPEPQAAPVVAETTEQRRARWLDWYGEGERGAVQRVYERELALNPKADRSFIGKEIDKAKKEKAEIERGGAMFGQLVQDGKRKG